jgi:hypothetical protein
MVMWHVLKERRTGLKRELSEAAQATRIRKVYLRALEEGDFNKLPNSVYAKGYLREYAKYLDLPAEELVKAYTASLESTPAGSPGSSIKKTTEDRLHEEVPQEDEDYVEDVYEKRWFGRSLGERTGFVPSYSKVIYIVPLLLAAIAIYSVIPSKKNVPSVPSNMEHTIQMITHEERAIHELSSSKQVAGKPAGFAEDKLLAAPKQLNHRLELKAVEQTWVQVIMDGNEKRQMLLNPGEGASFGASAYFGLKVGNAGGVRIIFDGKEIENTWKRGQVAFLAFPESYIDKVRPAYKESIADKLIPSSEASHNE